MTKPWGPEHEREGLIRVQELATEFAFAGEHERRLHLTQAGPDYDPAYYCKSERKLRRLLSGVLVARRVNLEIARVRDFAEGCKVREKTERWESRSVSDFVYRRNGRTPGNALLRQTTRMVRIVVKRTRRVKAGC